QVPEASVLPSGLKATAYTRPVCPSRVFVACWADSGDVVTSDNQTTPGHTIARNIRPVFGFIADFQLPRPSYSVRITPQPHFYPFPIRLTRVFEWSRAQHPAVAYLFLVRRLHALMNATRL